jgi:glycosyltransferase involved in cell wall biosynthesis
VPNGRQSLPQLPGAKEQFVLTAGRLWDEAKNVGALARVAPGLSWPVYVVGEAKRPGGPAHRFGDVQLLGRLPFATLASWLSRASIYALPARYEPFGLSALEAGMAGCALVLGDIPSLREVWGDAAVYVSPDDPEALKAALETLINDGAVRKVMAARARERSLTFNAQRMVTGYLRAYSDLTAGSPEIEEEFTCAS